ncbi:hypothetical protein [Streptomyces sp. 2224.1]|uniref:hypothetical protein n=1 Tax=Streptomyces sp. 2224.1 TaxID=1881020 RepID=UPI0015A25836|nr:hypothetical protein [Streptomyces sp. 2224.1]
MPDRRLRRYERVQVSGVDDDFFIVGREVEAAEEVVEGFGGDGEGVGVLALVALGEAYQQLFPVGREVDRDPGGRPLRGRPAARREVNRADTVGIRTLPRGPCGCRPPR